MGVGSLVLLHRFQGSRDQAHVSRLGNKYLYLMSHLAGPPMVLLTAVPPSVTFPRPGVYTRADAEARVQCRRNLWRELWVVVSHLM